MDINTEVASKNIFGLRSYWFPATIILLILIPIFIFNKNILGTVGLPSISLILIAFIWAFAFNFGAKRTKVENRSYDKALFLTSFVMLMNSLFSLLGNNQLIIWITTILSILVGIKIVMSVYGITIGKSIMVFLWSFLIMFVVIALIGLLSSILLTSLRTARMKAQQLKPEVSSQSQIENNSISDTVKNEQQGLEYLRAGKYAEAIASFTLNTNVDENDSESYMLRGVAKLKSGDTIGGVSDLTHALTKKNNDLSDRSAYYYRGVVQSDTKLAVSDFTNALSAPNNTASGQYVPNEEIYLKRALANSKLKNMTEALNDITAVININPNYESALILRALIEAQMGNLKAACIDATNGKDTSDPQAGASKLKAQIISSACK